MQQYPLSLDYKVVFVIGFVAGMAFLPLLRTFFELIKKYWWIIVLIAIAIGLTWGWPFVKYVACLICGCQPNPS